MSAEEIEELISELEDLVIASERDEDLKQITRDILQDIRREMIEIEDCAEFAGGLAYSVHNILELMTSATFPKDFKVLTDIYNLLYQIDQSVDSDEDEEE